MFCTQNVLDSTARVAKFLVHLCTTGRGASRCVIALRINNAISLLDAYQYWSKVKLSWNLAVFKKLITYMYTRITMVSSFIQKYCLVLLQLSLIFNHFCSWLVLDVILLNLYTLLVWKPVSIKIPREKTKLRAVIMPFGNSKQALYNAVSKRRNNAKCFCLFCLFGVFRPTREFFTHMEKSPLPVKGCKFWPMLGTRGHWAVRVL